MPATSSFNSDEVKRPEAEVSDTPASFPSFSFVSAFDDGSGEIDDLREVEISPGEELGSGAGRGKEAPPPCLPSWNFSPCHHTSISTQPTCLTLKDRGIKVRAVIYRL